MTCGSPNQSGCSFPQRPKLSGHPHMVDYARKGIPRNAPKPVLPRLEARTVKTEGGCWLYMGRKNRNKPASHRVIGYNGRDEFVHRVSWLIFKGPIPDNLFVLHKCIGHWNCWNPDHLYLGTQQDNVNDRQNQGRAASHQGELNGRAKISRKEVSEIRGSTCGFSIAQIAEMYGLSESSVYAIRRGSTWA